MKIKILKENFPNEMPSGPSLGQPGPLGASMPERQRKIMLLVDRIGKALDELAFYDKAYSHISQSFINLKPAPKLRQNQYGESFFVYDENGEQVYQTLEETALERARRLIQGRGGTNIPRYKRVFGKTISQATRASELLEEVNHFIVLLEALEPDEEIASYAKEVIYKDREIHFKNAGAFIPRLDNYGDYLAATGIAIESISKVIPNLSNPGVGSAIKAIAEAFTENYKSLWAVISEKLIDSGDVVPSRREFMRNIEPEILKHLMKIRKPTSLYDLLDDGFMEQMIEKFSIVNRKASIRSEGTAKILLRRALHALGDKGLIIMADGSRYFSPRASDEFILNPEMMQQAGKEYFPKPEGIMENKKIKIKILKEATGEQKRQQKKANWDSRDKQRRKLKARIKRSQNKGETPFNKDNLPDFDPMQDMAKIFKDKGYGVRIDGEEIED